jgi:SOS-response transcriptional repressor LexA
MTRTAQQLTIKQAQRLMMAKDTKRWRILDASMAPEFLPGDSVHVNPRLVPQRGDVVVARLANGSHLFGRYTARRGKAFDLIPEDKRRPVERINARSPGEVLGVAFMHTRKMRIDGEPRSAWSDAP